MYSLFGAVATRQGSREADAVKQALPTPRASERWSIFSRLGTLRNRQLWAERTVARIIYQGDDNQFYEVAVGPDAPEVTIGRHSECQVRTAGQSVSRKHACLKFEQGTYWLQDLGSSNGTFVGPQRVDNVTGVALTDGTLFRCGTFELRLDFDDGDLKRLAGATAAPPPPPPDPFDPMYAATDATVTGTSTVTKSSGCSAKLNAMLVPSEEMS